MDAVKYFKIKKRMCDSCKRCDDCLLHSDHTGCTGLQIKHPEEAVRIVEEWGKEHPIVTNLQHIAEGLRKLGYDVSEYTLRETRCPVSYEANYSDKDCKCSGMNCSECRKWWDEEYKENKDDNQGSQRIFK